MSRCIHAFYTFLLLTTAGLAHAQGAENSGHISVELNAAQTKGKACTLTFMITNGLEHPIDQTVYETVLFNTEGHVDRLTLFDFGTLPPARPRVRQFAVPQITCEQMGRILFNGASTCEGPGLDADACDSGLVLSTRTGIEVLG